MKKAAFIDVRSRQDNEFEAYQHRISSVNLAPRRRPAALVTRRLSARSGRTVPEADRRQGLSRAHARRRFGLGRARRGSVGAHGLGRFSAFAGRGGGLNPAAQYRRALEVDPSNVFAHTMLGFDVMRSGGSIADARAHFARALMSSRHREYVRHMQIAAVVCRQVGRQEARAPQHHHPPAQPDPLQECASRKGGAAEAAEGPRRREPDYPFKFIKERY